MGREVDVRRFETSRVSPERSEALRSLASEVSQALPGGGRVTIESFDPTTGNPASTRVEGTRPERGDYVRRALEHVQAIGPALGLRGQASEFIADPSARETSSGAVAVHLQQRYKGIPIFQSATAVRFAPGGALRGTAGSTITVDADIPVEPRLTAQQAVLAAARHVAQPQPDEEAATDQFGEPLEWARVDVSEFEPSVRTSFAGMPERPTVVRKGPFAADINASLVWFPLREGLVLGWSVRLAMPGHQELYQTIVDATSGDVLYCKQLVQQVTATGNVFQKDPTIPRVSTPFPRPIHDYKLPRPAGGQPDWRWCSKCQGLFFGGGGPSVCPRDGQPHDHTGLEVYRIVHGSAAYPGEAGWRWCSKCGALFLHGGVSKCPVPPAGSAHDPTGSGEYRVLASAYAPGQHGWRRCNNCRGMFWALLPGSVCPANGAAHNGTGSSDYALNLHSDEPALPVGFPDTWVAQNATVGNSTDSRYEDGTQPPNLPPPLYGAVANQVVTFNPADPNGKDQKVLNLFYFCCYMHDYFYLLGFREADGNFQATNFNRGGIEKFDRMQGRVHPFKVFGVANIVTPAEGVTPGPMMTMGVLKGDDNVTRHTALDSSVIFHEFAHGVTSRLVGGPLDDGSLAAPQSDGMSEGWSDYISCTVNDSAVVGAWLKAKPTGIRSNPYNDAYPFRFGNLGKGDFTAGNPHLIGEIWAATLLEINRKTDKNLVAQLVVDSLKLLAANPGFLDGRNAMFEALFYMWAAGLLSDNQFWGAWQTMWKVFCKYGMGPYASSNGAQLEGIVASPELGQPDWRRCSQCRVLYFGLAPTKCPKSGGGHTQAGTANYELVNDWPDHPGDSSWKYCYQCGGLFSSGGVSKCPATTTAHDDLQSGAYALLFDVVPSPGDATWRDTAWRKCAKCGGLVWTGVAGVSPECPGGGLHSVATANKYSLVFN